MTEQANGSGAGEDRYRARSNHMVIRVKDDHALSAPCFCWAIDDHHIGNEVATPDADDASEPNAYMVSLDLTTGAVDVAPAHVPDASTGAREGLSEAEREAIRHVTSVADWARPSVDLHAIGRWSMAMDVRDALAAHPAPETPEQAQGGGEATWMRDIPEAMMNEERLDVLLSEFYHSDDGDYVSALGDIRKHVAARESAAATRARAEERERIAQAIEALSGRYLNADAPQGTLWRSGVVADLAQLLVRTRDRA